MSRPSATFALLLACGAALLACSDANAPAPTGLAARDLTMDPDAAASGPVTVVKGTGDPNHDITAVQDAVNGGGTVLLEGHFSFAANPGAQNTVSRVLAANPVFPKLAEVKITKAVSISGAEDDDDEEMTTIDGGTVPFYIEAPGQAVTIRHLRFRNPVSHAILVFAVQGLEISSIKVEGLTVFTPNLNGAVGIYTTPGIPNPSNQSNASKVTGKIEIAHNEFDLTGGTATDNVLGVTVFSVGDSTSRVDVRVSGNRIRNTTEPAINFRRAIGRVVIDHNIINTGVIGVTGARAQVIRVANLGSYLIAHNSIRCEWSLDDAEGIGVFSQLSPWHMQHAVVVDNDIDMAPSAGTAFGVFNAGIGVYGFADSNVVRDNRIRGRASAGIATPQFPAPPASASPRGNVFVDNQFLHFTPADSDFYIGAGAVDTQIIGPGSVDNQGTGTLIVRNRHESHVDRPGHARSRIKSGGA